MTSSVITIDQRIPTENTLASGAQSGEPEMIIGNTPTAAAIEVRKIGRILRRPAWMAASLAS